MNSCSNIIQNLLQGSNGNPSSPSSLHYINPAQVLLAIIDSLTSLNELHVWRCVATREVGVATGFIVGARERIHCGCGPRIHGAAWIMVFCESRGEKQVCTKWKICREMTWMHKRDNTRHATQ